MNFNKKKRNYLIPSISIFCVLYIFLSTRPCGSEIHFSPEWTKDVHHTSGTPKDAELIPYKLNKRIGYFTEDGNIFSSISYPFKSAISDKWYCIYSRNNSKADFYFADGTKAGYELTLTKMIAENVDVPVIASGGGGTVQHMADVLTKGKADAALIATMVHSGQFSIPGIKAELAKDGIPIRL